MATEKNNQSKSPYREQLKAAFQQRQRKNPAYSIRAFARDLGLQPSLLHEAMHYKKGLSGKAAKQIGERLNWNPWEVELFVARVEVEHSRSRFGRANAFATIERLEKQREYIPLKEDVFRSIKDWYHNAILELTYLGDFNSEPAWISARLGISKVEAEQAIERLLKLNLLARKNGRLEATEDYSRVDSEVPSDAIKRSHDQSLAKAKQALYFQALAKREFTSATLAFATSDLKEAKAAIRKFIGEFSDRFHKKSGGNSVYNLSLQLFRIDGDGDENH